MRINKFVARATGLSRRAADQAITGGRVTLNGQPAETGMVVSPQDTVALDGQALTAPDQHVTLLLNKPVGYVVSRDGQGSQTIYDLLPPEYHDLKPVGRLDKDSSGLLLLTNDGDLANQLTHPRYAKEKIYEVQLNKPLTAGDQAAVQKGLQLDDGSSKLQLKPLDQSNQRWQIIMTEGRNRQIRRTFDALSYRVKHLHRQHFGEYELGNLASGAIRVVQSQSPDDQKLRHELSPESPDRQDAD
jgi:23S rRNA pseudouridine2605 synthase